MRIADLITISAALIMLGLSSCSKNPGTSSSADSYDKDSSWHLVWQDEFSSSTIDTSKWEFEFGTGAQFGLNGWGNNELEYYTSRDTNVFINDGILNIRALKEDYDGMPYTSARLRTKDSSSWKYGRIEARAKLAGGRGTWSAFWMLPTEWKYGGWPHSGEIDIIEHVGYNEGHVVASVHTGRLSGNLYQSDQQKSIFIEDAAESFHIYSLEWSADSLVAAVDNKPYFVYYREGDDKDQWPFDQEFHLMLNLAIGGNWGGIEGIDDSIFPTTMEIDHIHVYQKKD